ncbi:hypothetical protein RIF29_38187 [Crotalaria pallida]|uniref:K-box domain-containing protein n=1 Tax=Crotalaria pallida TaxID=3830 RepID=A0AAN9HPG4_CROPI
MNTHLCDYRRLYDKDLSGLSLRELQSREKHLNEQLLYVKEQKEEMLIDKIEQCRVQEQRAMLENEYLRTQVKELHSLLSVSEHGVPSYLQYDNMERSRSFLFTGASSSNLAINEHGGSEKTLDLGFPTDIDQKGKVPAKETSSNDSENAKL